jgi:hypothetical protein
MKRLLVVVLAAVASLFVGPMSLAYAGGMGLGPNVAFLCYVISGESPGGAVSLTDEFTTRDNLTTTPWKIGGAKLLCTPVTDTVPTGSYSLGLAGRNPSPPPCDETTCTADHLKCYDVRSLKAGNPNSSVTIQDYFRPLDGQTVQEVVAVGGAAFLCVGAISTPAP